METEAQFRRRLAGSFNHLLSVEGGADGEAVKAVLIEVSLYIYIYIYIYYIYIYNISMNITHMNTYIIYIYIYIYIYINDAFRYFKWCCNV